MIMSAARAWRVLRRARARARARAVKQPRTPERVSTPPPLPAPTPKNLPTHTPEQAPPGEYELACLYHEQGCCAGPELEGRQGKTHVHGQCESGFYEDCYALGPKILRLREGRGVKRGREQQREEGGWVSLKKRVYEVWE